MYPISYDHGDTSCEKLYPSLFTLMVVVFFLLSFFSSLSMAATAGTFNQQGWGGGISSVNAVHPGDQNSWNRYSGKDTPLAVINGGADLGLATETRSLTQTSDADFSLNTDRSRTHSSKSDFSGSGAGMSNTVAVQAGSVILSPVAPVFPTWGALQLNVHTDLGTETVPTLVDLDGDGLLDLMVGEYSNDYINAYRNIGTATSPVWTLQTAWRLYYAALPPGYIRPEAGDLDGDGDYDLLVGVNDGRLMGFENIGSASSPRWQYNSAFDGPDMGDYGNQSVANPALADLDNDGDLDLVVGVGNGFIFSFVNSSSTSPDWSTRAPATWETGDDVGSFSAPALGDLNGDGLADLIVGTNLGTFWAYPNIGTASAPEWGARETSWEGGIDVGARGSFSLGDVNNDGVLDLLGGHSGGTSHLSLGTAVLYPSSGVYSSPVMDIGLHYGFSTFQYSVDTAPAGTSITVDVRAGNSSIFDGSWVTLSSVADGADISGLGDRRYFQYVVTLTATDSSVTPRFLDATVAYLKHASGTNVQVDGSGVEASIDLSFSWAATSVSQYDVFYNLSGNPVYRDGYLYNADDSGNSNSRFRIIDVSNPASPFLAASTAHNSSRIYGVDIDGNYAYVASVNGLSIVDISNPASPVTVGGLTTPGWTISLVKAGDYVYIGAWSSGGLEVVDVSNPAAPVLVGSYSTSGSAYYVSYVNGYIYLTENGSNNVLVIDVSDPANPQLVNTILTGGQPGFIAVKGNYGYMSNSSGLQIYDVSNPAAPVWLATSALAASNTAPVTISGNLLYTSGSNQAKVLDISDPVSPVLVLSQAGSASIYRVVPNKNYLYTTQAANGLEIFNLGPYASSGEYLSSVLDFGRHLGFTTLNYTANLPPGTALAVDVRAGDTPTIDGGWGPWQMNMLSAADISSLAARQYLQYRIRLTSSDVNATPSLDDITFNYTTYVDSAQLTSSPYNSADASNLMGAIAWNETLPAGTDVQLQIRTAADSGGVAGMWSDWVGPDGTSATFWNSANTHGGGCSGSGAISCTAFSPWQRDAVDDQWVQYRVTLLSNLDVAPVVANVSMTYEHVNTTGSGVINISSVSGPTSEPNGAASFTVSLGSAPTADVTIPLLSSDLTEGVLSTSALLFTPANWSTAQTVTIAGVNDDISDGDVAYQVIIAAALSSDINYDGKAFPAISMVNIDDDIAGMTVTPTSGVSTSEAGVSFTFSVRLDTAPTADVTVGLVSSDTTEATIDLSTITFTPQNWNTPQMLTVTGVDDNIVDPATTYSIVISVTSSADTFYAAYDPADVTATNIDDEVVGLDVVAFYGYTTSEAGGFTPLSLRLTSMPTAPVTITLETDDFSEGFVSGNLFGPTSVTISPSNWDSGVSVDVVGRNDFEPDGNVAYNIITSAFSSADSNYNGVNPPDIAMTNIDNDGYFVLVSPTSGLKTTEAGGSANFNVKLGATPAENVTINFTSSDLTEGTVSPASITFTGGTSPPSGGVTVTVTGVDDRLADDAQNYTIQTTLVSSDANYSAIDPDDVSVTNLDSSRNIVVLDPDVVDGMHGTAVTTADINCDGTADLVVGGNYIDRGDVSIYFGNANGFSTERDQRIYTAGSRFGVSVVNLGDVNGDSCDDIAVGERGYNGNRGRLHIYYGSTTGLPDGNGDGLTDAADAALFFFNDQQGIAFFSWAVVADDFDNDGDTDLVISAPNYDAGSSNEGRTFLFKNYATEWTVTYGSDRALWPAANRADGWLDSNSDGWINLSDNTWDWAFETDSNDTRLGWSPGSMTSLNVNGDPYPDLAMGAARFTNGSIYEGRVYVFHGSAAGFNDADADKIAHTADADWVAESDRAVADFGSSVANAGDIDGDGTDDLLVGAGRFNSATSSSREGAVFLFKGSFPGGLVTAANGDGIVRAVAENDWMVIGPVNDANLGNESISSAGDFNGDGYPDVVVGGTGSNSPLMSGSIYVYLNDQAGSLETTPAYSDSDRLVWGSRDYLGTAVGTVGDVNGDGFADIYASGIYTESVASESKEGAVFLYLSDVKVPGVTVSPSSGLVTTESGASATFTVVLDAPLSVPTDTLTINVTSLNSAEGTVTPSQLSFDINNWNVPQTVTVTGVNDSLSDGNIPYMIDLAAVVSTDSDYAGIDPVNVSVTNEDNDVAVEVAVSAVDAEEGDVGQLIFVRSGEITSPLTVDYSVSGTATAGVDYVSPGTSVVIPAGAAAITVDVPFIDDASADAGETVVVTLLAGSGYALGLPTAATLTIIDDDIAAISVLPLFKQATTESGGSATFTVGLTSKPDGNVTVGLLSDNTSEGVVTPAQLVFTPTNWGARTVTIIGVDDGNTVDGDIDYNIITAAAVSGDSNYNGLNAADISVVNRDNDSISVPRLSITATNPVINEAATSGVLTVTRTGVTTAPLRVFYTAGGSAWPGGDYLVLSGAVDIPAGSSSAVVTIVPIQDTLEEGNETIIVALAPSSGYIIDQPSRETITLTDDDTAAQPPFANFWVDQKVGEGGSITVGVELSSAALNYPVTIPYTVSGTASNPADHDAVDGNIVISSGTSGSLTVNISNDGLGDSGETIIFTMGEPSNAQKGVRTSHTVTTIEQNEAAEVSLTALQNALDRRLVVTGDGTVVITAAVSDPNPGDTHTYDWSASNSALIDIPDSNDATFVFDPALLADGFYKVRLTVTDNGTPNLATDSELLLEVVSTAPALGALDSDNDGVIDSTESFTDTDGDGVADYLDALTLSGSELQLFATQTATYIMRTDAGLTLRLGDVAFAAGADGAYVTAGEISAYGGGEGNPGTVIAPDTVPNSGGYFDFVIAALPNAGQSARVVIPQTEAIPAGAVYRKYHPVSGWADFFQDANNQVASATGSPGLCPLPGSSEYSAGLTEGDYCIQLTIEDGGANDMDGQANRVIKDPAQIGEGSVVATQSSHDSAPPPSTSGGGGGGGAIHPLGLLLLWSLFWLMALHRHRWARRC